MVAAKRSLDSTTPLIHFRFVAMRHNEHEIHKLKEFAQLLGVDALSIKTLNPYDQGECHSTKADGLEFIPENPRYQRFEYNPKDGSRICLKRNPCKRLWNNPVLLWDGKLSPCDFDPHDNYPLGDLNQQSFREIWWGTSVAQVRHLFQKDYQKLNLCAGCTYAFKGGSCATETIAKVHFFNNSVKYQ